MKLLEIKDVVIHYITDDGTVKAVNNVSLDLDVGDTLGLVGETGAGKTTTALGILRLIADPPGKIVSGDILFEGESLLEKSEAEMRKIRGKEISMIFQDPMTALNPVLTVGDQIAESFAAHNSWSGEEIRRRSLELLEKMRIRSPEEVLEKYPHQLSGGMLQRIMIGIATAMEPALLIADEPTTAIDAITQYEILNEFLRVKQENQTAMVFISHDLNAISRVADRIVVLNQGRVVDEGDFQHILHHAQDLYTRLLVEKRADVMRRYRQVLVGKERDYA